MNEIIVIQPESLQNLGNAIRKLDNTSNDMLFLDAINSIETTNKNIDQQTLIIELLKDLISKKTASGAFQEGFIQGQLGQSIGEIKNNVLTVSSKQRAEIRDNVLYIIL